MLPAPSLAVTTVSMKYRFASFRRISSRGFENRPVFVEVIFRNVSRLQVVREPSECVIFAFYVELHEGENTIADRCV